MSTLGPGRRKSITVIPQTPTPLLDAFSFDAVISASESNPGEAFQHPVQSGAEGITDAVYLGSPTFSVTGISANTPIEPLFGGLPLSGALNPDRMVSAVELLLQIRALRIPVTVLCSWRRPMRNRWPVIVDLERNQSSGNTIGVSVNFVKFRIVQLGVVPQMQDSDVLAIGQQIVELSQIPAF